jgi:hypothetical protein
MLSGRTEGYYTNFFVGREHKTSETTRRTGKPGSGFRLSFIIFKPKFVKIDTRQSEEEAIGTIPALRAGKCPDADRCRART